MHTFGIMQKKTLTKVRVLRILEKTNIRNIQDTISIDRYNSTLQPYQ